MRFAKAYVEITNICNRNCEFCPKTRRKPGSLRCEDFLTIAQRLRPYTDFLYFHVMGEPLLHPQLGTLLDITGDLGFRVILTTNGTLLEKTEAVLLEKQALHKVNLSLHSFEANEAGDFADYVEGCCRFAEAAAQKGILVNLRLWNLDGAQTRGLHSRNTEILELLEAHFPKPWSRSRGGERLSEHVYLSWGERFVWPSLTEQDRGENRYCYGLKDQIAVLCDGTVVPCCLDHEGDIPLGNLLRQQMEEILQSERTRAIIEGFRSRKAVEALCRRCGYATRF